MKPTIFFAMLFLLAGSNVLGHLATGLPGVTTQFTPSGTESESA
jgi:hypothetical protein